MATPKKSTAQTVGIISALALVMLIGGVGVAMASGGPSKKLPPPNNGGQPPPDNGGGQVPPVNEPPPPPADPPPFPGDLVFDLETNWGGIPMDLRIWAAKCELAAGIPGIGRALCVKAWQAFRAGQDPVPDVATATAIAAANPKLCLLCENFSASEGAQAKTGIDNAMKAKLVNNKLVAGFPKPVDYDNWIRGSAGLFDILGSSFVYAGIHTSTTYLPFVSAPDAMVPWKSYEGQFGAATYIVYRLINGPYKVLVPGPKTNGDSLETWGNIFSAYANPSAFQNQTQYSKDAKAAYQARAAEIGIDLAKVKFPWPPNITNFQNWTFKAFYEKLLSYKNATVKNLPALQPVEPPPVFIPVPAQLPPAPKSVPIQIGDVGGRLMTSLPDDAVAPLVLVLHDTNAEENQFAVDIIRQDRLAAARYALLRGPVKTLGAMRAWYQADGADTPEMVAAKIQAITDQIDGPVLNGLMQTGLVNITDRIYVVGFGQGAAIAERLAATGRVGKALSIAGALPPSLRMGDGSTPTRLWAVHGTNDTTVPFADGQATVQSFDGKIVELVNGAPQMIDPVWLPVDGGFHNLASLRPAIDVAFAQMLGG